MKKIIVRRANFEVEPKTLTPKKGKTVICITTGEVFKSAKEAANYYGFEYTSVAECCAGKLISVGGGRGRAGKGYKFCYVADLAYKVNDITDYIKELKEKAEINAQREARIEEAKAQMMAVIQRYREESESIIENMVALVG